MCVSKPTSGKAPLRAQLPYAEICLRVTTVGGTDIAQPSLVVRRPPDNNNRGWKRTIRVFAPNGTVPIHISIWHDDDGAPVEIFLAGGKEESIVDQFLKECGKNYSRLLQLGMTARQLADKLLGEIGPISGQTDWPEVMSDVSGIQDLVGKVLAHRFCNGHLDAP